MSYSTIPLIEQIIPKAGQRVTVIYGLFAKTDITVLIMTAGTVFKRDTSYGGGYGIQPRFVHPAWPKYLEASKEKNQFLANEDKVTPYLIQTNEPTTTNNFHIVAQAV